MLVAENVTLSERRSRVRCGVMAQEDPAETAVMPPEETTFMPPELLAAWLRELGVPARGGAAAGAAALVDLFVVTLTRRAARLAAAEGDTEVEESHLERVLPQLLLDF